ncbi:hypothetical protein ACB035_20450, partial [Aeromonas sp. S12(2024)]|uniref:hypothetical protein n=1 Tax=Aeromonas sp. S12(2024) TaxID=3242885 RepID=UPI003528A70D
MQEANEAQAQHVTAEGDALPKKVWVMNTEVTPASGTIMPGQFIDLAVTVRARDLALHQDYDLSADEMGKVVCLAEVGGSELPRGAVPSGTAPWVYEAVNPQPNRVTLRVRAIGGGANKTLCVRTRAAAPQHPGWHDSNKDNLDGSVSQARLNPPVPPPIALTPWNSNETMYFWGDGTHSCYNSAEKVFYKGRYDFDARGMRRNDTLSGWP